MKCLAVGLVALLAAGVPATSPSALAASHSRSGHKNHPPKKYDSQEVIKKTRDVDRSRVIETKTVIPSKRVIETNHLIIHENETRNVGTVQHNHTIIEKELVLIKRNVDHKYVNTVVNLVKHKYNTRRIHVVEEREIPGEVRYLGVRHSRRCDDCRRPLRTYGMKSPESYPLAPRYVRSGY